ncbi:UTRA domain-containing protein [Streptomyces albidoflavus]|uniref:GntR family transcriptional regulator n=1 Tax=Streptomyces albidoflavus TaxID=1886 RepID=UPI00101E5B0F|nr:UTRA domain-containing protein [Streptomyces albidoflavus]RZD63915.1 UTRA domain-containing protein [Streptomyces albidoflavus]
MGSAEQEPSTSARYLGAAGDAWAAEARAEGRRGTQRIVRAGEEPASALVAERLSLRPGQPVIARRRIMYADDEPCELTDTYYPVSIARGTALAGTAKIRGGAVRLLAELGHVGTWVEEDVTARLPTPDEAATLTLSGSEPLLQLVRLTEDADGHPIQLDVMAMAPGRQRLRYRFRAGDAGG